MSTEPLVLAYYYGTREKAESCPLSSLDGNNMTHLAYAFALIGPGDRLVAGDQVLDTREDFPGEPIDLPYMGNFRELQRLKKKFPHLKVLISAGGWTGSKEFSELAKVPSRRKAFAESCRDFIGVYGFDGIDVDWEFPNGAGMSGNSMDPADPMNYVELMKDIREAMDQLPGPPRVLSTATWAFPEAVAKIDYGQLATVCNYINVMTYDFYGEWDKVAGHISSMHRSFRDPKAPNCSSVVDSIEAHIDAGAPAHQVVMGLPLYAKQWEVELNAADARDSDENPPVYLNGNGQVLEQNLTSSDVEKAYAGQIHWDETARVPYVLDRENKKFISFDNRRSIEEKISWARERNLGGVMYWEASQDPTGMLRRFIYNQMMK